MLRDALYADYVEMVKRERGDYFGRFDETWLQTNAPMSLYWLPGQSRGFVTYPVITRAVRAKIATEMSTPFKFTIEAIQSIRGLDRAGYCFIWILLTR